MKYFVLLVSLFLLYSSLVSADSATQECIFKKYMDVSGKYVVTDCENKIIIGKQLFDINITLKNEALRISPHPDDRENKKLKLEKINNNPPVYSIKQPLFNKFGYNLILTIRSQPNVTVFLASIIEFDIWDLKYGNETQPKTPPIEPTLPKEPETPPIEPTLPKEPETPITKTPLWLIIFDIVVGIPVGILAYIKLFEYIKKKISKKK